MEFGTMRIVFMGTPDFAVPTLRALHEAGHDIVAVYTQPPRPAGRGKQERKSPVHVAAEAMGIPVCHPHSLRDLDTQADFLAHEAELGVVVAYGLILPKAVLEGPVHGCLNVHASLLPRWRGAAPIQRAILAGDHVTGVTIMQMEEGLDTGPMLASARVPIEDKTAGELHDELAEIGAHLLVQTVAQLADLKAEPQPPRCDLCRQDRQGGSAHRLAQAGRTARARSARLRALSRIVVRAGQRAGEGAARPRHRCQRQRPARCSTTG